MSLVDLWSDAAMVPRPRVVAVPRAIVPRERIYPKPAPTKLSRPTAIENLAAMRERERQDALAAAWREGFRAAELGYALPVVYGPTDHAAAFAPTMISIIAEVARKHGLKVADLKGPRRNRPYVRARQEAMYRCYRETDNSLPAIGRAFGNRDHTTVLHGIRRHSGGACVDKRD